MAPPNPVPADAKNCVLFGYLRNARGLPEQGVSVIVTAPRIFPEVGFVLDTGTPVGEGIVEEDQEVLTNQDGYFAIELRRGRQVRLQVVRLKLDVTHVVPDQNNQDVAFWCFQPTIVDSRQFCADPVGAPTVIDTTVVIKVESAYLPMIMGMFDQIQVFRADTLDGTYAEVTAVATRLRLVQETIFYEFTETTAPGKWYKARFHHSTRGTLGPLTPAFRAQAPDYAVVCTVDELKEHFLFGVNLTDDKARPFPRSMFEHYLRAAIEWASTELDLSFRPTARVERQDYYVDDFRDYGHIQLDHLPVIAVDKVEYMMGEQVLFDLPLSWLNLDQESGILHLVPAQGALANVILSQAGLYVGPSVMAINHTFPAFFRITYRHGFGLGQIPADIKQLIMLQASIGPLNVAGDLIIGAGIANTSVSAGGVSQSIGSTSSATNSGYGARIILYQAEIKRLLPLLRRHWQGIRCRVV